jgi:hypothetical protein
MKHFSERETNIILIIGRKNMTLSGISKQLFRRDPSSPLDPEIAVANSIRRIIKKCDHHKLKWTLEKTRANNKLTIKRSKV